MKKQLLQKAFFKFLLIILAFTGIINNTDAQVANYTCTQNSGTFSSVWNEGQSTGVSATSSSSVAEIDFPFFFYVSGIQYYRATVSSNGFITFGSTDPSSTNITPLSSAEGYDAAVSAMGRDLQGQGSAPRFWVSGLPPYRVCTFEFKNFRRSGATGDNINFQIKICETTNIIQIVYGTVAIGNNTSSPVQVGLRGTANTDFENRNSSSNWASTAAGTVNTHTVELKSSVVPASGLTFTFTPPACTAPLTSILTPVISALTSTGLTGTFIGNVSSGYLVVRTETSAAPNVISGLKYPAGYIAAGGYIESNGTATTWKSSGLAAGKQYWFWVYPYTSTTTCSMFPQYKLTSPGSVSATTSTCTAGVNSTTISAMGTTNWTAATWSAGHVPTPCETVTVTYTATSGNGAMNLDTNVCIKNLTIIHASSSTTKRDFSFTGNKQLIVDGDLTISGAGAGSRYSRMQFNVNGRTLVNGNVTVGTNNVNDALTTIGSTGIRPEQTYVFKGSNVTFLRKGFTIDEHATFIFDGTGTQNFINNASADSATDPILFEQLYIGDVNSPTVVCSGTWPLMDVNDRNRGGVMIGTNATLELPAGISLNGWDGGAWFVMKAGSTLKLGDNSSQSIDLTGSIKAPAITNPVGSNFPLYFSEYIFDPTSTIEYNGGNSITQTIYDTTSYSKLVITNGSGSSRAQKITTGAIQVNSTTTINNGADVTLGNVWSNAAAFNVLTNGGLYCAANVVSGAGAFTLNNYGYLGMGHAQGISSGTTMAGNIQMTGGRSFSTSGNYIYNGNVNQITGNGLPGTCNDLTINNSAVNGTVTISTNQIVNGINLLQLGTFDIGTTKVKISGTGTLNSIAGKMKANIGTLELNGSSGTAQGLAGSWFINKNISTLINSNTKGITVAATANDTLLISSALLYGSGTTNSLITTNNNLTLLSRDTATARFGEIVSGSLNSITGNVNVERYLPTLRKWRHLAVNTSSSQTARQSWMENNLIVNGNLTSGYGTIVTDDQATWSANGFDSKSVSGPSVKFYNPSTNTYSPLPNTHTYPLGTQNSYYNFVRGDRSCTPANANVSTTVLRTTGTLKTGTQTFPVTATKFASVGNPYASAIDLRNLTRSSLTNFIYVWDPKLTGTYGLGAYQTLSLSGGEWIVTPGGGSYGVINSKVDTIESGQGFFVKSSGAAGTLIIDENAKTKGARTMSRQGNENYLEDVKGTYVLLSLVDPAENTLVDGVKALFDPAYHADADDEDGLKLPNTSENLSLKRDNMLLVIEQRPEITSDDTLFLNFTGLRAHTYQWDISFDNMVMAGREAFLVDNYLATSTPLDLSAPNAIQFNVVNIPGAYAPNRFMIVFRQPLITVALPVRFSSISAVRNTDKTVTVNWTTETEISMQDYKIERSSDGRNFTAIGSQLPTNNNGGGAVYNFIDAHASEGDNYYRVRGNSINGRIDYTAIVKVGPLKQNAGISIYPNPVTDNTINVRFANLPKGIYQAQVINNLGQVLQSESIKLNNSNTVKSIKLAANTAKGTYQLRIADEEGDITTVSFIVR